MAVNDSTVRVTSVSTAPPAKPASAPSATPRSTRTADAPSPSPSAVRAPCTVRAKTSRPSASVPSGCPCDSGGSSARAASACSGPGRHERLESASLPASASRASSARSRGRRAPPGGSRPAGRRSRRASGTRSGDRWPARRRTTATSAKAASTRPPRRARRLAREPRQGDARHRHVRRGAASRLDHRRAHHLVGAAAVTLSLRRERSIVTLRSAGSDGRRSSRHAGRRLAGARALRARAGRAPRRPRRSRRGPA